MNIEEIFEKIKNKELTICETCDNIFDYVLRKVFCDECNIAKRRKYYEENCEKIKAKARKDHEKNRKDPEWVEKERARGRKYHEENREKINAKSRKFYEENMKDPEWVAKYNAKARKRYHARKNKRKNDSSIRCERKT